MFSAWTSMELIAEDAPRVTEGYRMFEPYGCYSAKVSGSRPSASWPRPDQRRLEARVQLHANTDREAQGLPAHDMDAPVFHLENYAPDAVIAKSEYGGGREIMGQEWNDSAVARSLLT